MSNETQQERLMDALKFIGDISEEGLQYVKVGTGAEVALRHIARKVDETLAESSTQQAPVLPWCAHYENGGTMHK